MSIVLMDATRVLSKLICCYIKYEISNSILKQTEVFTATNIIQNKIAGKLYKNQANEEICFYYPPS